MMNKRQLLVGGGALALAGAGVTYFGLRQMGSMEEYNASVAATRVALSEHLPIATRDRTFKKYGVEVIW